MNRSGLVRLLLRHLLPLAICLTTYLYFYPVFHGCVFPSKDASHLTALSETLEQHWNFPRDSSADAGDTSPVPFRLLVLADPQLEGDSSLPKPEDGLLHKLDRRLKRLRAKQLSEILPAVVEALQEVCLEDVPQALRGLRKQLDLFGNDYYLGHIFRTLHWWTRPTHVTVLGDLIGSQWVTNDEFEARGWRFWNRVFARGHRVEDEIAALHNEEEERPLDMEDGNWTTRIINIAGNHDIGYAGDISPGRVDRFERVFGKANWDVRFQLPQPNGAAIKPDATKQPSIHLIVLNSLILDSPALSEGLQAETSAYINGLISRRLRPVEDRSSFTLLLTHLPLHKANGTCVDGPFFDYWGDDDGGGVYKPHGLKEQNHLSEQTSHRGTLGAIFGMSGNIDAPAQGKGRNGLILTGHDHEGCDTWHFLPSGSVGSPSADHDEADRSSQWDVSRWENANHSDSHTGVREVTLRSMMGDYGGNAGLLSAWFDYDAGEWKYDIQMCGLNLKVWWAVHILDLAVLGLFILRLATHFYSSVANKVPKPGSESAREKKDK